MACILVVPAGLIGAERNLQSLTRWWKLVATKASDAGYDLFAGDSYSLQNQSLQNATRHLGNFIAYEFAGGSDDRRRMAEGEPLHAMDAPLADHVLAGLRLAIVVLAGWLTWQAGVRRDRLSLAAAFGLCSVATLVVSPIARAHYFVLLVPAMPLVPLWFARAGHAKFGARWAAWIPAGLVLAHYLVNPVAGRLGLLGIGTATWFAASATAMIVILRRSARLPQPIELHAFRVRAVESCPRCTGR